MSHRSNMAFPRSVPTTVLPEKVQAALSLRGATHTVPAEVETALRSIPFFASASRPSSRSSTVPSSGGGGRRFGGFATDAPASVKPPPSDDGFETYHNNRRRTGGSSGGASGGTWRPRNVAPTTDGWRRTGGGSAAPARARPSGFAELAEVDEKASVASVASVAAPVSTLAPAGGAGSTSTVVETPTSSHPPMLRQLTPTSTEHEEISVSAPAAAPAAPAASVAPKKFSSAALRASAAIEDRMMMRVKGKVNRLGASTYDTTKVFMQQILSSDDTVFLDELMTFLFSKASLETRYCPLYARLIHELADEFPHFRVVLHRLFTDYITTFAEVDAGVEPNPDSEDYEAFKKAQERKRARRGYSQFVAELVKLGEVDVPAFSTLLSQIQSVIEAKSVDASCALMCEEYIDCLASMCHSASGILSMRANAAWAGALRARFESLAAKPSAALIGFTSKARFAMMGLADYARAGWRSASDF